MLPTSRYLRLSLSCKLFRQLSRSLTLCFPSFSYWLSVLLTGLFCRSTSISPHTPPLFNSPSLSLICSHFPYICSSLHILPQIPYVLARSLYFVLLYNLSYTPSLYLSFSFSLIFYTGVHIYAALYASHSHALCDSMTLSVHPPPSPSLLFAMPARSMKTRRAPS